MLTALAAAVPVDAALLTTVVAVGVNELEPQADNASPATAMPDMRARV